MKCLMFDPAHPSDGRQRGLTSVCEVTPHLCPLKVTLGIWPASSILEFTNNSAWKGESIFYHNAVRLRISAWFNSAQSDVLVIK